MPFVAPLLANSYWPYVAVIVLVLAVFLLLRQLSRPRRLPYERRKSLITKTELKFFRVLEEVAGDGFHVFAMVRIADLIRVKKGSRKYRSWLNKILAKHVDFVLCDKATLQPLIAIELDDRSHDRPDRMKRDELVNQIFASCDFPLLRIRTQKEYDIRDLRKQIQKAEKSLH